MRRKSNQKANSLRVNRGNSRNKNSSSHDLPQRNLMVKNHKVFRFSVPTDTLINGVNISPSTLRGIPGLVAIESLKLMAFTKSIRVKRITIHSPPVTFGSYTSASVLWLGTYAERILVSDTSINTSRPVFVTSTPPPNSLASFWRDCLDTDPFMTIRAPVNSIIDFELEWVQYDGRNTTPTFSTASPILVGDTYYGYLDGGISSIFRPIGLATYQP